MQPPDNFLNALAEALGDGVWQAEEVIARARTRLGRRYRWLPALIKRALQAFGECPQPTALRAFLVADKALARCYAAAIERGEAWPAMLALRRHVAPVAPLWLPTTSALPSLHNCDQLAAYLGLSPRQLSWLADDYRDQVLQSPGPRQHYNYRWVAKRAGGYRLIEAPKSRLKAIQREILCGILDGVPPHCAAHGFRSGHDTQTFVSPHVRQCLVLRLDLRQFFPSIGRAQVAAIFRALGYGEHVASLLARLCTNAVPDAIWYAEELRGTSREARERRMLSRYHLPQGSPTSPALANLAAYSLDCRLQGLAESAGGRYTRYADDLLFSGDESFARGAKRLATAIATIALEEGFEVHYRKTRLMRQGVRQHAAGLVLNEKPNIDRRDYDRLKAILHNCVRHGPTSQNHRADPYFRVSLQSHIAYVRQVHRAHGEKLQRMFERIVWNAT